LEFIENAIKMASAVMPQVTGLDKMVQLTAIYRGYPDRIQERMNEQLAIVGEEIDKYFRQANLQTPMSAVK
jgi:hypothetical protein